MTVKTFRKKPIQIQAVQWTGDNEREIREWCGPSMFGTLQPAVHRDPEITAEVLDTLHSTWVGVKTGQWIVRGVKGEYYPIAEDVLAETYEPVAEPDPLHFDPAEFSHIVVDGPNAEETWTAQQWNEYIDCCKDPRTGGEIIFRIVRLTPAETASFASPEGWDDAWSRQQRAEADDPANWQREDDAESGSAQ